MSTRTYELTVPVRKGQRGMGIVVNPENCVIELAADGPAMARPAPRGRQAAASDGAARRAARARRDATLAKKPAHDFRVRRATETREMLKNVRERELEMRDGARREAAKAA